jgi:hypothetical protein
MNSSRYDLGAKKLATMLSGSTLLIPNLKLHLVGFRRGTNKYTSEIRQWVDRLIDELVHYFELLYSESSLMTEAQKYSR